MGLYDLSSAAEPSQNRERRARSLIRRSIGDLKTQWVGWIDDLSNRRIALYKCTSANPTKEKASAIMSIQTQTASCHCVRSDLSFRVL